MSGGTKHGSYASFQIFTILLQKINYNTVVNLYAKLFILIRVSRLDKVCSLHLNSQSLTDDTDNFLWGTIY